MSHSYIREPLAACFLLSEYQITHYQLSLLNTLKTMALYNPRLYQL